MSGNDICWQKSDHVAFVYLARSLNTKVSEMGSHGKGF